MYMRLTALWLYSDLCKLLQSMPDTFGKKLRNVKFGNLYMTAKYITLEISFGSLMVLLCNLITNSYNPDQTLSYHVTFPVVFCSYCNKEIDCLITGDAPVQMAVELFAQIFPMQAIQQGFFSGTVETHTSK